MTALLGLAAFALLVYFEICKCAGVKKGRASFNPWFIAGTAVLILTWVLLFARNTVSAAPLRYAGAVFTAVSVFVYYRVLAETSKEAAYTENRLIVPVYKDGTYSKMRHPGVWCFAAVCLGITLIIPGAWAGNLMLAILNLVYCILQDRYFFPVYLEGYEEYKHEVPFCIPVKGR